MSQVHKGHKFYPQQFKVQTVCEHCSKAIPLLESGEVCEGKTRVCVVWTLYQPFIPLVCVRTLYQPFIPGPLCVMTLYQPLYPPCV